MPNKE